MVRIDRGLTIDLSRQRWLTIAALPVTLLILILGYFAVKREHKGWFCVFGGGCLLSTAYFVYKVTLSPSRAMPRINTDPFAVTRSQLFIIYRDRDTDYKLVFKSLTVFASFSLAALVWTTVSALICFKNFGRGLKYHSELRIQTFSRILAPI